MKVGKKIQKGRNVKGWVQLWQLQDLFVQKECLEIIRYDFVNEEIIDKALIKVDKEINKKLKELEQKR